MIKARKPLVVCGSDQAMLLLDFHTAQAIFLFLASMAGFVTEKDYAPNYCSFVSHG